MHFLRGAFRELMQLMETYAAMAQAANVGPVPEELLRTINAMVTQTNVDYLCQEIPTAIEQSLEGVERVAEIVRAMKEFSHPDEAKRWLSISTRALRAPSLSPATSGSIRRRCVGP